MRQPVPPPVFSRRSFLLFIFLAPAGLLTILTIIVTLQYRQFRAMVSPESTIPPVEWTSEKLERVKRLQASLHAFGAGDGRDSVWYAAEDLTLLAASSRVVAEQSLSVRLDVRDTVLVVETSQRVDALQGRFAWIFQRITPVTAVEGGGWLNARMEGLPEWNGGRLEFAPVRGWLNDVRVPRAALTKRAGMSLRDFVDGPAVDVHDAITAELERVVITDGGAALIRN